MDAVKETREHFGMTGGYTVKMASSLGPTPARNDPEFASYLRVWRYKCILGNWRSLEHLLQGSPFQPQPKALWGTVNS